MNSLHTHAHTYTDVFGSRYWLKDNDMKRWSLHREGGPALEYISGSKAWYIDGKLHRIGAPAMEHSDGTIEYYVHGRHHREDGPAFEIPYGYKSWYLHGEQIDVKNNEDFLDIVKLRNFNNYEAI